MIINLNNQKGQAGNINMSVQSVVSNRERWEPWWNEEWISHLKPYSCNLSNKIFLLDGIWPKGSQYATPIPGPFIKLLLIIAVTKALRFITLVRYYFHFNSKIIFCLMSFVCYGVVPLFIILIFSSLFLFLTFFFLSFLLSYYIFHSRSWNQCSQVMVVQNAR